MFNCLIECQGDKYNFRQSEECSKGCGKSFRMAMTIVDNELKSFQVRETAQFKLLRVTLVGEKLINIYVLIGSHR